MVKIALTLVEINLEPNFKKHFVWRVILPLLIPLTLTNAWPMIGISTA